MSRELIIKEVGVAVRCEVCHQADLYNGQTNQCLRCEGIMDMVSLSTSGQVRVGISERQIGEHKRQAQMYKVVRILVGVLAVVGICEILHHPLGVTGRSFLFSIIMYLVGEICKLFDIQELKD